MIDMARYWPAVLGIGVGTFLIRFSFILIMDRLTLPEAAHRMLRFIPASVLPAIVVPAVLLPDGAGGPLAGSERILAALVAVAVAWKTRSILFTIASGMGALWALQALL